MPLYEYQCDACGRRFEVIQKFSDPSPDSCTLCGSGPVRRLQSSPAIQFKGTGWYITDYAQKSKSSEATDKAEKSDTKGDAAAAPAKTAEASTSSDSGKAASSTSTQTTASSTPSSSSSKDR